MRTFWSPLSDQLSEPARLLTEELRALKDDSGLSLDAISAGTYYSRASWGRWLNGRRLVTRDALVAFAEMLGVDIGYLLTLHDRAVAEPSAQPAGQPHTLPARATRPGIAREGARCTVRPRVLAAQLPASTPDFTGREDHVRALATALAGYQPGPGQVRVTAVCGGPGMGKTALALYAAHLAASQFPDGSLYADLRGTQPEPRDPADVLAEWLLALDESASLIPPTAEGRAARFRSLTRDRRLLIMLDDARSAAQVSPLLPASEECAVLITSRARLADLPGAQRLAVGPLTDPEATAMVEAIAGTERLAAESSALKLIVEACAGLPLALRAVGAKLSARQAMSAQQLASRLTDSSRVLDELAIGDLSVRASIQASYDLLPAVLGTSPRDALRLLGHAPRDGVTLHAAAALLRTSEPDAERALDALADMHLIEEATAGHYRLHDLVRLFAAELA